MITLVIIGVVAALTIPSVVVSYQKHQAVTKLKKAYSTLVQTTNKAIADWGPIKTWEAKGETGNGETKAFVDKYIAPYLNIQKNCGYETTGACKFHYVKMNKPNNPIDISTNYYKIILSDGTCIMFQNVEGIAGIPQYGSNLFIDINGQKAPNMLGKDVFQYTYNIINDARPLGGQNLTGKFMPYGAYGSKEQALKVCQPGKSGISCTSLIMFDNWEMRDYYPW